MRWIVYITLMTVLFSCLEKDPIMSRPGYEEVYLRLEPKEVNKVYINLRERSIVKECIDSVWHLKFQNGHGNWAIFLNPLYDISLHKTTITNFDQIDYTYILDNLIWTRDIPLENSILPAFGTWGDFGFNNPKSFKNIYILKARIGLNLSYYKIQIQDVVDGKYKIRFSKLDGTNDKTVLIEKSPEFTHSYLKLSNYPKLMIMEPPADSWQLCMTFGLDSFSRNPDKPAIQKIDDYIGVFQIIGINKSAVEVAIVSEISFEEIDYFYAKDLEFESYEQLPNVLAVYNKDRMIYEAAVRKSLVIRKGMYYYKVKAHNVSSISLDGVSMQLHIQSL